MPAVWWDHASCSCEQKCLQHAAICVGEGTLACPCNRYEHPTVPQMHLLESTNRCTICTYQCTTCNYHRPMCTYGCTDVHLPAPSGTQPPSSTTLTCMYDCTHVGPCLPLLHLPAPSAAPLRTFTTLSVTRCSQRCAKDASWAQQRCATIVGPNSARAAPTTDSAAPNGDARMLAGCTIGATLQD